MARTRSSVSGVLAVAVVAVVLFFMFQGCEDLDTASTGNSSSTSPSTTTSSTTTRTAVSYAEILDWNWRKDPDFGTTGTIKWNVQLKNNSNRYFESARVEFTTYDSGNRLVSSTFTYVDPIPPGGVRAESSYADYYGTEERATVQVVSVRTSISDQWNLDAVEIADVNWRKDPSFGTEGTIHWTVQIRNLTQRYVESVRVEFSTFDSSGDLVSTTFTYVDAIPPGGTRSESSYAEYYGTESRVTTQVCSVRYSN